jgi:uncharacterized membrane protein
VPGHGRRVDEETDVGIDSGAYKFVLVLHLVTVIVGFGSIFLAGVFDAKARARGGAGGQAVAEVTFDVTEHWSQWFVYAVPIFGIALVLMSDDYLKFSQAWVSISFLLYIVFLGLVHGLHVPNLRRMNEIGAELVAGGSGAAAPAQATELDARAQKAAAVGAALNLIMVVIVFLMVFKPGL